MRVELRAAIAGLAIAAIVGVTGCSGQSWKMPTFWKGSSEPKAASTPAPAVPAPPSAEPATPAAVEPAPAPEPVVATAAAPGSEPPVVAAAPAPAVEAPKAPAPIANGFSALPELADVRFAPGQITVGSAGRKILDRVVQWLKANPAAQVMIEGHTDDLGPRDVNRAIAEQRARSVMQYLVANGIESERISVTSYGSDQPVCTAKTSACRAKNRRVRFLVRQP